VEEEFVLTGSRPDLRDDVDGGAPNSSPGGQQWRPARLVTALSLLSAVVAVVVSRLVFPSLSIDNDEAIYRYQAQALAHGHLFPPAPNPPASFTPWLAAIVDHHYVMKYTPLMPGFLAASLRLTGSYSPILALIAAAMVTMTYLLAVEVLDNRRVAVLAAAMMAASPLIIVQSGTLLAYLLSLVLLEIFAWSVVRGVRTDRMPLLALAGLAIGLSVVLRPFDAVLFGLPLLVWALFARRRQSRSVLRGIAWMAGGAVLPVAGLLAFDVAATGSAFTLPFGFLESKDAIGFGVRKLFPTDTGRTFTFGDGVDAVATHLWLLGGWAFGGLVTAPLTVWTLLRRRLRGPGAALVASGVLLAVGYIGFWGSWNAANLWGGVHYVGPFYLLPLLIPFTLGGALGLVHLLQWRRLAGVVAVVVSLAVSGYALWGAIQDNGTFNDQDQRIAALLGSQGPQPLYFVAVQPPFLLHPTSLLDNGASLGQGRIYAVASGNDDLTVLAEHPDHPPLLVHVSGFFQYSPHARWTLWTQRLEPRQATTMRFALQLAAPRKGTRMRLVMTWAGLRQTYDIAPYDRLAGLVITAQGAELVGRTPTSVTRVPPGGALGLELDSTAGKGRKAVTTRMDVQRFPARVSGDQINLLAPGPITGTVETGLVAPLKVTEQT
jgi:hypothetical protein